MKHFHPLILSLALLPIGAPIACAQTPPTSSALNLSPAQISGLEESLEKLDSRYDPKEQLLAGRVGKKYNYNTNLRDQVVHPTRESLTYARQLLDTGNPKHEERAFAILRRVAQLQETDPQNKGYGVWAKFLEEPLDKAPHIDPNWADFLGKDFLNIALYHEDRLPPDLKETVKNAVLMASAAIKQRNMGPHYTNIAVMGTYVTMIAGHKYDQPELKSYALQRLKTLVDYTRERGGFREFNSPTYTMVTIEDMSDFARDVRDPQAKPLVDELYRFAWLELASHFHEPTRAWAGPHSRAYTIETDQDHAKFIESHTSDAIDWGLVPPAEQARIIGPMIPLDLEHYFLPLKEPRTLTRTFEPASADGAPALVGPTYLHPDFALGTVNWGDMWNQSRSLLAHWGKPNKVSTLELQFLHDDYDFQSMKFYSQQREGRALIAMNLATDGGDKHPSRDRIKNATIKGRDFRARWKFGGASKKVKIVAPATLEQPARIEDNGVVIQIAAPRAQWGELKGRWETTSDKNGAYLDIVFYDGPEKTWKLDQLEAAIIGMALQITPTDAPGAAAPIAPIEIASNSKNLTMKWEDLDLSVTTKPQSAKGLLAAARFVGGTE